MQNQQIQMLVATTMREMLINLVTTPTDQITIIDLETIRATTIDLEEITLTIGLITTIIEITIINSDQKALLYNKKLMRKKFRRKSEKHKLN
jgi:hypothetical protein